MPSIKGFNIDSMRPYTITLAVGMRGSGKSVAMANVLGALTGRDRTDGHTRISKVYVISDTEPVTQFFSRWVKAPEFFATKLTPELLQGIIDVQRAAIPTGLAPEDYERIRARESICLVLDDITFCSSIFKTEPMKWLFMNGRHYGFCVILGMQYCMDMPANMRSQVDYVFAMHEPVFSNRKKLYEYYFGVFDKFATFREVFATCTENYKCMVLDKHIRDSNPFEVVFWFLATKPSELTFKAGSAQFRAYNRRRGLPAQGVAT